MSSAQDEFAFRCGELVPMPGFTNIQAYTFLRERVPDVSGWLVWKADRPAYSDDLAALVERPDQMAAEFRGWNWERVPCGYPDLFIWAPGERRCDGGSSTWTGLVKVTSPSGEKFLLFSYLSSAGRVGDWFFASTTSTDLLHAFGVALMEHRAIAKASRMVPVHLPYWSSGKDEVDPDVDEQMIIEERIDLDIFQQADFFFRRREAFERLGIPHRRGFLFVGPPGNGKTMMVRRVIRESWKAHRPSVWRLTLDCPRGDEDVREFLGKVGGEGPALVIIEEIDSLVKEGRVTRGGLLSHLDGICPTNGILLIGTSNNPSRLDPALAHRPSRFDRVWRFENPSREQRMRFLRARFSPVAGEVLVRIAAATENWSFAYLNELRTSAAILAIRRGAERAEVEDLLEAPDILASQFQSGSRNHNTNSSRKTVGFGETA